MLKLTSVSCGVHYRGHILESVIGTAIKFDPYNANPLVISML